MSHTVEWILQAGILSGLILGGVGLAMVLKSFLDWLVDRDVKKATAKWPKPPPRVEPYSTFDAWRSDLLDPNVPLDTILERSALGVPKKPKIHPEIVRRTEQALTVNGARIQDARWFWNKYGWQIKFHIADEPDKLRGAGTMVLDEAVDSPFKVGQWVRALRDCGVPMKGKLYEVVEVRSETPQLSVRGRGSGDYVLVLVGDTKDFEPAYPKAGEWWFHDKSKYQGWEDEVFKYDRDWEDYADYVASGKISPIDFGVGDYRCKPKDGTCA